ncbi:unnamed protein product [Adineta ricciae]|uniref:NAD(P)(+)--arginine ADP-ribosyltransferase n=1 Tax=Adineta ricciae TaxID=249248 RepID=A0A816C7V5_ADIRI|nr:unnamed protein product [Adineta ricciae]CAF1621211.1 unnamed protein product [Adineta ricciae]
MSFSFEINHRLLEDIRSESKQILESITDYEQEQLVSLEQACQPLKDILGNELQLYITVAKLNSKEPKNGLSPDESASIYLYTMEWSSRENSLYVLFNYALRTSDRSQLRPWFQYMKLFFTAFYKLPSIENQTVWHGISEDLSKYYREGEELTWWSLISTTSSFDVLQSSMYLGRVPTQTVFAIETNNGKLIRAHSHLQNDDEILLPPGIRLIVTRISNQSNGIHIIYLRDINLSSSKQIVSQFARPQGASIVDIQRLLNQLDILCPNGKPINLVARVDGCNIPTYITELFHFYGLTVSWINDYDQSFKMLTMFQMAQNPEQIAKANWEQIKQMFIAINWSGRFSYYTTWALAIERGYIRLILLRMKELAEQETL